MNTRIVQTENDQVATLTLNRPERHNALDETTIAELHRAILGLQNRSDIRVIVIAAEGQSFCAGADLEWMRRAATLGMSENFADARQLAALLYSIANSAKPVVARVQGPAYGGGVGLIAACDIVVAARAAKFALTEVRLGLVAATISPYVVRAIGERHMRRYLLSAQVFDAARAAEIGLISECVEGEALDASVSEILIALKRGSPHAQAVCKDLLRDVVGEPLSENLIDDTARFLAEIRASAEAREGICAFLEKRTPAWCAARDN